MSAAPRTGQLHGAPSVRKVPAGTAAGLISARTGPRPRGRRRWGATGRDERCDRRRRNAKAAPGAAGRAASAANPAARRAMTALAQRDDGTPRPGLARPSNTRSRAMTGARARNHAAMRGALVPGRRATVSQTGIEVDRLEGHHRPACAIVVPSAMNRCDGAGSAAKVRAAVIHHHRAPAWGRRTSATASGELSPQRAADRPVARQSGSSWQLLRGRRCCCCCVGCLRQRPPGRGQQRLGCCGVERRRAEACATAARRAWCDVRGRSLSPICAIHRPSTSVRQQRKPLRRLDPQ